MLALRDVVDRKLSLIDACVHMGVRVCVYVPSGNNQFWAFGITLALVCQDYTNMQTGKKDVVYFAICIQ